MYVAVRRYQVKPGSIAEIAQRANASLLPIIRSTPGFLAYYAVDSGNDTIVTFSVFEDQAGAEESTRRATDWVRQNVAPFVVGAPEISGGETFAHVVK
jgi:quinol monooxygenase YgiN